LPNAAGTGEHLHISALTDEPPQNGDMGVRGSLVYCADHRCSHSIAVSGMSRPDDVRLSDIEPRSVCRACGKRGADVKPDFNWDRKPVRVMGYR